VSSRVQDGLEALAGAGLVLIVISPILYALWRARGATEVSRIPAGTLRLTVVVGVSIALAVYAAMSLGAGASAGEVLWEAAVILAAVAIWLGAGALVWHGVRRRRQR
jgi:hypothetical protein